MHSNSRTPRIEMYTSSELFFTKASKKPVAYWFARILARSFLAMENNMRFQKSLKQMDLTVRSDLFRGEECQMNHPETS